MDIGRPQTFDWEELRSRIGSSSLVQAGRAVLTMVTFAGRRVVMAVEIRPEPALVESSRVKTDPREQVQVLGSAAEAPVVPAEPASQVVNAARFRRASPAYRDSEGWGATMDTAAVAAVAVMVTSVAVVVARTRGQVRTTKRAVVAVEALHGPHRRMFLPTALSMRGG